MTNIDERAKFEKWVCEVGVLPLTKLNAIDDDYLCPETETAWKAWQAASAESAKELAEKVDRFRHIHVKSDNGDICADCGFDLRDDIHVGFATTKKEG